MIVSSAFAVLIFFIVAGFSFYNYSTVSEARTLLVDYNGPVRDIARANSRLDDIVFDLQGDINLYNSITQEELIEAANDLIVAADKLNDPRYPTLINPIKDAANKYARMATNEFLETVKRGDALGARAMYIDVLAHFYDTTSHNSFDLNTMQMNIIERLITNSLSGKYIFFTALFSILAFILNLFAAIFVANAVKTQLRTEFGDHVLKSKNLL